MDANSLPDLRTYGRTDLRTYVFGETGSMGEERDVEVHANGLAAESLADGDPTGWFERLYAHAAAGEATVPWDRGEPNALLVGWAGRGVADGGGVGKRALVVGCGLGRDAEFVAGLGFRTTAFDVSPTAVAGARARFPGSVVEYVVADLLEPPAEWAGAFDLVLESITVQSMPLSVRADAIGNVARTVAPGGRLLVISGIREEGEESGKGEEADGPPWPLTRSELDSFAVHGLRAAHVERVPLPDAPDTSRWRAEFHRGHRE